MQADTLAAVPESLTAATQAAVPFIPPSNAPYLYAAFGIATAVYLVYAVLLITQARAEQK
ncbi:MAG: hypothetical protein IPI92_14820 [Gemmatimonadetes bacterium]|nr:hypothetical protein [Gemmatimonadota bacterium]MBK7786286.1 hypothetical protein [Gemmatimonadota bacterium]